MPEQIECHGCGTERSKSQFIIIINNDVEVFVCSVCRKRLLKSIDYRDKTFECSICKKPVIYKAEQKYDTGKGTISICAKCLDEYKCPKVYCPICKNKVQGSEYLKIAFKENNYAYWLACLVTHYRHQHINYYDRSWQNPAYRNSNPEYHDYDSFKEKVNNRAKRQMLRAFMKDTFVSNADKVLLISAITCLRSNEKETVDLMTKLLGKLEVKKD